VLSLRHVAIHTAPFLLPFVIVTTAGCGRGGAPQPEAAFVGRERCAPCHAAEDTLWRGSHHDLAMTVASDSTVRGDFDRATFVRHGETTRFQRKDGRYFVTTPGPGGVPGTFEVKYTFGWDPLQQYLVAFPDGRIQALTIAWDTRERRWFDLYPGQVIAPNDPLYWTNRLMNWNYMCADCHSTHVAKNFDSATNAYHTTWSEIDVSCEACHGPGSRHVAWAARWGPLRLLDPAKGLAVRLRGAPTAVQLNTCAPCHSRRHVLMDGYVHGRPFLDYYEPSTLDEGLYYADGQILEEDFEYGSFTQSKMFRRGVRCSDCHDPHSGTLRGEGNATCDRCHLGTTFDTPKHHFHPAGKPGSFCIDCHMPTRNFMVVHKRRDHSIRLPRPDLTESLGVPNACNQCHADSSVAWAVGKLREWYGPEKPFPRHYGTTFALGRRGDTAALPGLVALADARDTTHTAMVRATAVGLLAGYARDEADGALLAELRDPDALVRTTAARSLDRLPPDARRAALAPLLDDPVRAVRLAAVSRLASVPRSMFSERERAAFEAALSEYVASQRAESDQAGSYLNLGVLYGDLGENDRAEQAYLTAIRVDSTFIPARMNLAVFYNAAGRNADAERMLRQAIAIDPAMGEAYYSLGLLLAEEAERAPARIADAAEELRRAAALLPDRARVQYNAALALERAGRRREALAAIGRAERLDPSSPEIQAAARSLRAGPQGEPH
jgi:tetratricopeptide (TPR) repeat protein